MLKSATTKIQQAQLEHICLARRMVIRACGVIVAVHGVVLLTLSGLFGTAQRGKLKLNTPVSEERAAAEKFLGHIFASHFLLYRGIYLNLQYASTNPNSSFEKPNGPPAPEL